MGGGVDAYNFSEFGTAGSVVNDEISNSYWSLYHGKSIYSEISNLQVTEG